MTFDDVWELGIVEARRALLAQSPALGALADAVARPSFAGALMILAAPHDDGQRSGPVFRREVAEAVAARPPLQDLTINAEEVERTLGALFVHAARPSTTGHSDDALETIIVAVLEREDIGATADEARELVRLLETGQFFHDLIGMTGAVFSTIPALPTALLQDLPRVPRVPIDGLSGLFGDLAELVETIRTVSDDLRDGTIDEPPQVTTRLLTLLYGLASIAQVRDLLQRLLAPENRSVRLALLLYARANGFAVTEAQLETVHRNLLATDTPDLGPVIAAALTFLRARYADDELAVVLAALQRGGAPS